MGEFLISNPAEISANLLSARPVENGESVNAPVTNRLPLTNAANNSYLFSLIRSFRDLSGEFLWGVPVAENVVVGDFVFFDAINHQFRKALSRFIVSPNEISESETSLTWGVVISINGNKADICTSGLCDFQPTYGYYANNSVPGQRYLSDTVAGTVTNTVKYPYKCVGYLVAVRHDGRVQFFVRPYLSADPNVHQHKSFALAVNPSGTWTTDQSVKTVIASVDTSIAGWIPADNDIFNSAADKPINAVFGYNPAYLTGCGWPLRNAVMSGLKWQRVSEAADNPLFAAIPKELYKITDTTIWWCTDIYLPWDERRNYTAGVSADIVYEDSEELNIEEGFEHSELLQGYEQRIFLEVILAGDGLQHTQVTSLTAAKDSGLVVRQYPYGGPANTGDLEIDWRSNFIDENPDDGHAVKTIQGRQLVKTPIVSRIRLNSSRFRLLGSQYVDSEGYYYGSLTIGDPTGIVGSEVPIEATHLNGVFETLEQEVLCLAFPSERPSFLLSQLLVPYDPTFQNLKLAVRLGILTNHSIPADVLKLSYRIIPNPAANNQTLPAFPSLMADLVCNLAVTNVGAATKFYTAETEKFDIHPGELVIIKIERTAPDALNYPVPLIRKSGLIYFP